MIQQPVSTPWQVPWPEGTIARYWTVAGATVDLTDNGRAGSRRYDTKCTGCPHEDSFKFEDSAHRQAQAHAERCRALPRPEVTP
ncbi:hypothetical protein [Streptomyces rubradiris]|uniref:Uncharacterized protein n=1 Tax=Streptomyces rubradiris TaxID=285531 RepID=A0ABQ3R3H9_STRRR|nr:hypothetical protein [Streptomyces rubradiris]GHH30139.1 hypothetical protein GCM10018792_76220 [Streptomyces rubradiris]GHI50403.1 hypothetical protein Srubr_02490 [Streptomyces rubradiris]